MLTEHDKTVCRRHNHRWLDFLHDYAADKKIRNEEEAKRVRREAWAKFKKGRSDEQGAG